MPISDGYSACKLALPLPFSNPVFDAISKILHFLGLPLVTDGIGKSRLLAGWPTFCLLVPAFLFVDSYP
jgi:hypothetical protein